MTTPPIILDLFISWITIYGGLVCLYFITGWIIECIVAKNPNLKIQKGTMVFHKDKLLDIKQSVISLLSISFFIALGYTLQGYGFSLFSPQPHSLLRVIIEYPLYFILSLILFDTWFYWMHRLIHVQPLFKYVHAWHHRRSLRTPSTWANNSDTLLDDLFLQSYWFFAFVLLPFPAIVLFIHKIYDQITGMMGHSGYEISGVLPLKWKFLVAVVHHDQHHSAVKYNFATHFSWWDRMAGTLHPDYDAKRNSFKR
ncbi:MULTISPECIES: sterol desaturase family protein [unclassified Legionella]|uniref:sterol desaturase family protein n=1 Tax=unclassified Legionella TaxID=2622702 RepID=UPI00105656F4|nr:MULTISPECIES: sterol desaturase family protein [unclassified Legionella]MDI9819340.1 sterol desaturase family protein [Legionella sp. PL877]